MASHHRYRAGRNRHLAIERVEAREIEAHCRESNHHATLEAVHGICQIDRSRVGGTLIDDNSVARGPQRLLESAPEGRAVAPQPDQPNLLDSVATRP